MREPWTGGMDSPQFSEGDLNGDGIRDLFVFDRVSNRMYTYLGNGGATDTMYTYAPQYEALMPNDLNNWAMLRDYNHDGIPDIFAHANSGIKVYKGSVENGVLRYNLVAKLLSYFNPPFANTNIWTTVTDIPVITDVNGDGDLDVLSYDIYGGSIGYFENLTSEHQGDIHYDVDSFQFSFITSCWGNFVQNPYNNSIVLNTSCKGGENQGGGGQRHSGNSIYSILDPTYHTVDLLNGNIGFDNLLLLRNGGDRGNANITEWDSIFPRQACTTPMAMPTYPAAFGVHVNSDGLEDVLMSPNVYSPTVYTGGNSRNVKNVWLYKNLNDSICWYDFQNDSFIVHHMLDFGTNSKAVFYDFDGDGLNDIITGNYGYYNPAYPNSYQSTLAYYRNTGTISSPKFTEVTLDYDSFSNYVLIGICPAFGDLDGDGKADLLIGDKTGFLSFFKNRATTGSSYPSMDSSEYFHLNAGTYSAPFIYDVNGDSLNDIVVGRADGKLSFYWNFGTKTSPQFSQDSVNTHFGGVNVCQYGYNQGNSQPFIMETGGQKYLYVGSLQGTLFKYVIDPANLYNDTAQFTLIDSNLLGVSIGGNSTVSIADINNDGKMEYLLGNALGGLLMYSDSLWDPSTILNIPDILYKNGDLHIYPNPAKDYFACSMENFDFVNPKAEVFNLLGEKMNVEVRKMGFNKLVVGTITLANGLYLIRVSDSGNYFTGKVLIEK
ncbi:MAG: repeat protein [Bacteroidota bacterium]|nr:repeat protein [Bacteroidota bacterium]